MNNHIRLLNKLCDIYEDRLIYRTIIVTDNKDDSIELYNILENADYSALIVDKINSNINYNEVDKRIVIITKNKFKSFIKHLNNTFCIANSSYNLVLFSYNIEPDYTCKLEDYYKAVTKNLTNGY